MNCIYLDGENYQMSEKMANELRAKIIQREKEKSDLFIFDKLDNNTSFENFLHNSESSAEVQIGMGVVHNEYKGKCLVLSNNYNWKVIENTFVDCVMYKHLLIGTLAQKKPFNM